MRSGSDASQGMASVSRRCQPPLTERSSSRSGIDSRATFAVSALIERAVKESGARIVSADGVGNGDGAADAFLRAILDAAAAFERELIRARTRAAMAVKRAKGERSRKIPYGLALAEDGRHLVEDGVEQSVIARVKALRAEGHAVTRIAKALEALGIATRSGRPWHPQRVARMLK